MRPRKIPALSLSSSPLVHVLAQVRFSPVLRMMDYLPSMQEAFRLEGFPLFNQEQTQTVTFSQSGPEVSTLTRWLFNSKDGKQSVVLSDGFISLAVAEYRSFGEFAEVFRKIMNLADQSVRGELVVQRVGLRYIDLVRNAEGLPAKLQLDEGLRGLREEQLEKLPLDLGSLIYAFETRGQSPHGTLVVKLHQTSDGGHLPPDLRQTSLSAVIEPPIESEELVTLLDIDHFSEMQRTFEADPIVDLLWELHDYTDLAFRMAVTPEALALWNRSG